MRLGAIDDVDVLRFGRRDSIEKLAGDAARADMVFHLAGVNRPADPAEFEVVNHGLTATLIELLGRRESPPTVVLSSSTQAALDNPYGRSKLAAERAVLEYGARAPAPVAVYRLPGVFGKWSRPDYNTVVATFCRNAADGVPLPASTTRTGSSSSSISTTSSRSSPATPPASGSAPVATRSARSNPSSAFRWATSRRGSRGSPRSGTARWHRMSATP